MNGGPLGVFLHDRLTGRLTEDDAGMRFTYEPAWLAAGGASLSLSLPLRPEAFDDRACRPFFSNLLPDADVRRRLAALLGLSPANDFALLREVGGDCAGAVSLLPDGETPARKGGVRQLGDEALLRLLAELPTRPLLADEDGVRLSLAGAQHKLPVVIDPDDGVWLPMGSQPSSHILKPSNRDIPHLVANEFFCLRLAAAVGLPVAAVRVRPIGEGVLQVERYDRRRAGAGHFERLHQEDFCQALGVAPDRKYEVEGGPGLEVCFQLIAGASIAPAPDRLALLRWTIFNLAIGNADAHAKNVSLLLDGGPRLAPFYDLVCTAVYRGLSKDLAMAIGGERLWSRVHRGRWDRLAAGAGMNGRLVRREVASMLTAVRAHAPTVADASRTEHPSPIYDDIVNEIQRRHDVLAAQTSSPETH